MKKFSKMEITLIVLAVAVIIWYFSRKKETATVVVPTSTVGRSNLTTGSSSSSSSSGGSTSTDTTTTTPVVTTPTTTTPTTPTVSMVQPAWLTALGLTRLDSSHETSLHTNSTSAVLVSVKQAQDFPITGAAFATGTGLDASTDKYPMTPNYNGVVRLNPTVLGSGGIQAGGQYTLQIWRKSVPTDVFQITFTVPTGDLAGAGLFNVLSVLNTTSTTPTTPVVTTPTTRVAGVLKKLVETADPELMNIVIDHYDENTGRGYIKDTSKMTSRDGRDKVYLLECDYIEVSDLPNRSFPPKWPILIQTFMVKRSDPQGNWRDAPAANTDTFFKIN